MDTAKIIEILSKIVDSSARQLVGTMCKRIEVLEKNNSLSPNLLKSLNKELIYENSRVLKQMLRSVFIPSISFVVSKNSKEEK